MASTKPLASTDDRKSSLGCEHHPDLGDYTVGDGGFDALWTQQREMANGQHFLLCGRGKGPSDEQITLWSKIEAWLPELIDAALKALEKAPRPWRAFLGALFRKDKPVFSEVRMEQDGMFTMFFDTMVSDQIYMWPMVTFSGWTVSSAEWVPLPSKVCRMVG